MAALKLKQDSVSGQLTLTVPVLSRLGNVLISLVWAIFLLIGFIAPLFSDNQFDWFTFFIFLVVLLLTGGSALWRFLSTTTVTIDRTTRTIAHVSTLAVFPMRSTIVAFNELDNLQVEYYRQSSGRYAHDAWRLVATTKDNRRVMLNWDGKQNEMMDLGQQVAGLTGVELIDQSVKPASTMQKIFDTLRGGSTIEQPSPEPEATPMDETTPEETVMPTPTFSPTPANELSSEPETVAAETPVETRPAEDLRSMTIDTLEKRIADDSMDSEARYVLARKYHARGQVDRAMALYQDTLRLDPTNTNAQNDIGVALQQRGKRTEAEAAYRRAIALDPFSTTAHLNLALLLRSMNRATEASQEFFQVRQNARSKEETQLAEAASTGAKLEPQLSKT